MSERLGHQQYDSAAEFKGPERRESVAPIDVSTLLPHEVVALHRYAVQNDEGVLEALDLSLPKLAAEDPARAADVLGAFTDSPLPEDRQAFTIFLRNVTKANHELGVELWDRLMRDSNAAVRLEALMDLNEPLRISDALKEGGDLFTGLERVDQQSLIEFYGLTPTDVHSLLRSYYAAENSQDIYDPGKEALRKLQETRQLPSGQEHTPEEDL